MALDWTWELAVMVAALVTVLASAIWIRGKRKRKHPKTAAAPIVEYGRPALVMKRPSAIPQDAPKPDELLPPPPSVLLQQAEPIIPSARAIPPGAITGSSRITGCIYDKESQKPISTGHLSLVTTQGNWYADIGQDGKYEIREVPEGTFDMWVIGRERFIEARVSVTVVKDEVKVIDVFLEKKEETGGAD